MSVPPDHRDDESGEADALNWLRRIHVVGGRRAKSFLRSFGHVDSRLHPRHEAVERHVRDVRPDDLGDEISDLLLEHAKTVFRETRDLYAHLDARRLELMKFEMLVVGGYFAIAKLGDLGIDWAGAGGTLVAFGSIAILLASGWTRSTATSPPIDEIRQRFHKYPPLGEPRKSANYRKDALAATYAIAAKDLDAACKVRATHLDAATTFFLISVAAYGLSLLLKSRGW